MTRKFVRRPPEYEAMQFVGTSASATELASWANSPDVTASGKRLVFGGDEVEPGDWLVRTDVGLEQLSPSEFLLAFKEA